MFPLFRKNCHPAMAQSFPYSSITTPKLNGLNGLEIVMVQHTKAMSSVSRLNEPSTQLK